MGAEPEAESAFESFLAEVSTRLTGLPGERVHEEIEHALRSLGEFLETDRVTLFEFQAEGSTLRPTHSWARPPFEPYSNPDFRATYPWVYEQLVRGEIIRFERLPQEAPEEASQDRAEAIRNGFKSNLTVPIAVGGRFLCALGTATFETYRSWPDATVARVRTLGQILAAAIHRQRAENAYLRAEIASPSEFENIVGRSGAIRDVLARVAQVATMNATVLLLGETG